MAASAAPNDVLSATPRRSLPQLDERTTFFWRSGEDGQLRLCRCNSCGFYIHPPAPVCRNCHGRDVAPQVVSGKGTVVAHTINRQVWEPGLEAPYVVAMVEIAEQGGVRLTTNVVNCPIDAVHNGMKVRVLFDHREDVWLPLFEPEEQA